MTNWAIDQRVVSTYFGNIAFAYQDYGLPYCFCASLFNTGISQPNGYTEEAIDDLGKGKDLTEVSEDAEVLPNILFVQLESFFDTSEFTDLQTSEDPLPNLRKMFQEYSSGYFKVPSVGAGTANTEFEVLTGMNLRYFGPGEYPYKTVLKDRVAESAATALASFGYGTHAIHNNGGNFYSRAKVFNNIGFDSFTSKEFMNVLQLTENGWAKDDILLTHIQDALDSTEQQDFVFTVSVQGHGNYPEEKLMVRRIATIIASLSFLFIKTIAIITTNMISSFTHSICISRLFLFSFMCPYISKRDSTLRTVPHCFHITYSAEPIGFHNKSMTLSVSSIAVIRPTSM